jgi:hypothetical protein
MGVGDSAGEEVGLMRWLALTELLCVGAGFGTSYTCLAADREELSMDAIEVEQKEL